MDFKKTNSTLKTFSNYLSRLMSTPVELADLKTYRVFFLLVRPNFSAKKENVVQPMRIYCTSRISWNRISDWLPIVFHFGTENWADQSKKPPYINDDLANNAFAQ